MNGGFRVARRGVTVTAVQRVTWYAPGCSGRHWPSPPASLAREQTPPAPLGCCGCHAGPAEVKGSVAQVGQVPQAGLWSGSRQSAGRCGQVRWAGLGQLRVDRWGSFREVRWHGSVRFRKPVSGDRWDPRSSTVGRSLVSSAWIRGSLRSSSPKTPHFLGVPRVGVLPPYGQLLFSSGFPRRDPASNCLPLEQFILPLSPIPRSRRHHHAETPGLPMGPSRLPECLDPHLQAVTGPRRSWTSDTELGRRPGCGSATCRSAGRRGEASRNAVVDTSPSAAT
ncbi:hypothetical protein HPB47_011737 [Ixodes persulcatus]|uniref:Uncharacterized protein n=1 Tax=Ixodes persulcatus TaxID=34615 RepID=A0AC60NVE7_IXOPE|nr:hypothetical protein HPB47_011737 [Ixodes persulcatus]